MMTSDHGDIDTSQLLPTSFSLKLVDRYLLHTYNYIFYFIASIIYETQGPTSVIFVKKMAHRCGVWQIKRMTSLDQDQVSMKSNMFGFRGYSQMKFYKTYKTAKNGLVWFGLVRAFISR